MRVTPAASLAEIARHSVEPELAVIRAEIARDYPGDDQWSETIRAKIRKFWETLNKSSN
jgi:hypothetical protein